jgi:16S rRNA processing protein RimM
MAQTEDDLILIGHVLGAHGVRGQVRVFSNTSPRENIVTFSPWILARGNERFEVAVNGKKQGKNVLARLQDVETRDQAEELAGAQILIHRDQLPQLGEGDFYWSQLVGLKVKNLQGVELGEVDQMIETGANDVMVVQGDRERLIPYVMEDVVKTVDLDQQQVMVDWLEDY